MGLSYTSLDNSFSSAVAGTLDKNFTGGSAALFTSIDFLFRFGLVVITVVGAGMLVSSVGLLRMTGTPGNIAKSNENLKRISFGLLGVYSLITLLYTFNRDLVNGDIGLDALRVQGGGVDVVVSSSGAPSETQASTTGPSTTSSKSCTSPESTKQAVVSGNVCAGVSCNVLGGCRYQQYLPIIKEEAAKQGINPKVVVAVMCKESRGDPNAKHLNSNGTYDCGLMQVNQKGGCTAESYTPQANIAAGITKIKGALAADNAKYGGVPAMANVFAAYNCCANGDSPYSASRDCSTDTGWPAALPKWACPINPGEGDYNMCAVKNYACEIVSCITGGSLEGL
jgi:hypothetical protein